MERNQGYLSNCYHNDIDFAQQQQILQVVALGISLFIDMRHCCLNDSYVAFIPSQWSFGVVLWEIVTLAKAPYQAIDSSKMEQHLQAGHRLPQPNNCPYDL